MALPSLPQAWTCLSYPKPKNPKPETATASPVCKGSCGAPRFHWLTELGATPSAKAHFASLRTDTSSTGNLEEGLWSNSTVSKGYYIKCSSALLTAPLGRASIRQKASQKDFFVLFVIKWQGDSLDKKHERLYGLESVVFRC